VSDACWVSAEADGFPVRGELDMAGARRCRLQLMAYAATGDGELVCDCSGLEFLDSSGISMLLDLQRELTALGRVVRLKNVVGSPRRALETCGLTEHFGMDEDALIVLTPPAIVMLRHLSEYTVVGDPLEATGLAGVVARDALAELESARYVRRLRMPNRRPPMFVITVEGRRKNIRLESGRPSLV
jgi:anti-anti-sigma factor